MLHNRIDRILDGLKITPQNRKELNRLIERPEVQAVLNADEDEQLSHRRVLLKELDAIPAQTKKAVEKAAKSLEIASKRFEEVEAEYKAAEKVLWAARHASNYADYPDLQKTDRIKRELIAGADPRIGEYRFEIGNLIGRIRTKLHYYQETQKDWNGEVTMVYTCNVDDVAAARTALNTSLETLHSLELSALTGFEMTQRLKDLTHTLKDPLAEVEMHPPTLDEYGKVKEPERDGTRVVEEAAAA